MVTTEHKVKVGTVVLTVHDIVLIKAGISLGIVAAIFAPPPWHIPIGILANMVWVWRL